MVEGHLAHKYARQCAQRFAGRKVIVTSPNCKFNEGAALLNGRVLTKVEANGKHIFLWFGEYILHLHLGMFGSITIRKPSTLPREGASFKLRIACEDWEGDVKAPICCEVGNEQGRAAVFERLGPDPLREDADPERFWKSLQSSRETIGALLLDQRAISGLGNIYRAEVLFVAGIHPNVAASSITRDQYEKIWKISKDLLDSGRESGKIITVADSEVKDSAHRKWSDRYYVYKKRDCRRCGTKIRNWASANRRIFACETCQPPPTKDPAASESELYPSVPDKRSGKRKKALKAIAEPNNANNATPKVKKERKPAVKRAKVECAWGGITFSNLLSTIAVKKEEEAVIVKKESENDINEIEVVVVKKEENSEHASATKRKQSGRSTRKRIREEEVIVTKTENLLVREATVVTRRRSARLEMSKEKRL